MEIVVNRKHKKEAYTIGEMLIDGVLFCQTLEDKVRDFSKEDKVYGETAIPSGVYNVILSYSPKFQRILPLIENVPQFSGIRIHRGNTPKDTSGCILVGENKVKGGLINSTPYEIDLVQKMRGAIKRGESVTLTIS